MSNQFNWHKDALAHLAKLEIEAIMLIDNQIIRSKLFPYLGSWDISGNQCDCVVGKRIIVFGVEEGFLAIELIGTAYEHDPVLRFKIIFSNSDGHTPPGPIQGRFGVLIRGPEPFVDSAPRFQLAHAVAPVDTVFQDAIVLGDTSIGDQQQIATEFLVGFGGEEDGSIITAKERVYDALLYPGEPNRITTFQEEPLLEPILERPGYNYETSQPFHELLTTPRDPGYNFGYRNGANWSGPDRRFGSHPSPELIHSSDFSEAAAIVTAELLRTHTRYPDHCGLADVYLEVPNPEAIYYDGSLSEHSRNRLGRPHRPVPSEWNALRDGWEAPRAEWVASVVTKLAWYANDMWAKRECIKLGYKQMNTMHKPIPINEGGYDCVYLRIMRALWRGVRLLYECARVCERAGWAHHADTFYHHTLKVFRWAVEEWKPINYGLMPRNESETVPGHEVERVIPAWQIMHLPVAYFAWKHRESEWAKVILEDLSRVLVTSYVEQEDGSFLQRKLVLAYDPTIGWKPSLLDGLDLWPTSGLKLIAQKGSEFGMSDEEIDKAKRIHAHHCERDRGLGGGPWVTGVSEWSCGDFTNFDPY